MELDSRKNESRTDMKKQDIIIEASFSFSRCLVSGH